MWRDTGKKYNGCDVYEDNDKRIRIVITGDDGLKYEIITQQLKGGRYFYTGPKSLDGKRTLREAGYINLSDLL